MGLEQPGTGFYVLLVAVIAFGALSATAEPYSYEINGAYSESDIRFGESELAALGGSYFFSPVDNSDAPLAQAEFAERASGVTLTLSRTTFEITPFGFGFVVGPIDPLTMTPT